jgi:hypothetical protein
MYIFSFFLPISFRNSNETVKYINSSISSQPNLNDPVLINVDKPEQVENETAIENSTNFFEKR